VKLNWLIAFAILFWAAACDPTPRTVPCSTYVAGGFNREDRYAFAVEGAAWPRLGEAPSRIEVTFLLASGKPQTVDLVHVQRDREIERWTLQIPTDNGRLPLCVITADPVTSTCNASMQVSPQDPSGYWYLRGNDDLLEAGMSFVLCSAQPTPATAPSVSPSAR
jgi:hypothetical protein